MVYVVTHSDYGDTTEILGVTSTLELGRELAEKEHDKNRDHKVTTGLQWDEHGVAWSMARGKRYHGHYEVEEFPVL